MLCTSVYGSEPCNASGQAPLVDSMKTAVHVKKMLTQVAEVEYVYSADGAQWKPIPTGTNPGAAYSSQSMYSDRSVTHRN